MVLRAHVVLCLTEPDFFKKPFFPKLRQKYVFLNLLENFVTIFYEFGL